MISPNFFVYSAYCQNSVPDTVPASTGSGKGAVKSCPIVTTIALFRDPELGTTEAGIRCMLWYDDVRAPKEGIPSVSRLGPVESPSSKDKSYFYPYLFNCENKFSELIPYGITFEEVALVKDGKKSHLDHDNLNGGYTGLIHIHPLPNSYGIPSAEGKKPKTFTRHPGTLACLGPTVSSTIFHSTSVSPSQLLLEQVLLQNYFGVSNFVIYDSAAVTRRFWKTVKEKQLDNIHSNRYEKLSVSLLPWNIPIMGGQRIVSSEVEHQLAETDCYFRTVDHHSSSAFESSIFLNSGQVLVPRNDKIAITSVPKLLQHLSAEALSNGEKVPRKLMFHIRHFCPEYRSSQRDNNLKHAFSALSQTLYTSPEHKVGLTQFPPGVVQQSNVELEVEPQLGLIHDYSPCGEEVLDEGGDESDLEKLDKMFVQQSYLIEESLGKYFPSIEANIKDIQKSVKR